MTSRERTERLILAIGREHLAAHFGVSPTTVRRRAIAARDVASQVVISKVPFPETPQAYPDEHDFASILIWRALKHP
jgi:hypothetical protein